MKTLRPAAVLAAVVFALLASPRAVAHCDTLNGPVVQDARAALAKGDVTPVLKWVTRENEEEVRAAFAKTFAVRKQSTVAAELADLYFFETLVRLHRAGEGEPYTGLKPAEAVEPGVQAADAALAGGDSAHLMAELQARIHAELNERFARVLAAKKNANDSVAAGRTYVAAYVAFVHFAEQLFDATAPGVSVHGHEPAN
jgi:hypothetical protein